MIELPFSFCSASPRKNADIMWVSSVEPITIISEGIITDRILIGIPSQPMSPNVQIMASTEVINGMIAARTLRMKNRIDPTSTRADSGPSNLKSSVRLCCNSALIRGGPTWNICSKWVRWGSISASNSLKTSNKKNFQFKIFNAILINFKKLRTQEWIKR